MWALVSRIANAYNSLLVSRRGAYSVERVLAFNDYCAQTSTLRALLVCLAFPLPSLALILLIEAVPLQDPALGLERNYGLWLRLPLSAFVVVSCLLQLGLQATPEIELSIYRKLGVVVVSTVGYIVFLIMLACSWRFPIPFKITFGAPACCIIFFTTWVVFIGLDKLKALRKLRERVVFLSGQLVVIALLCVVYPLYNAVFVALGASSYAQNAFVLVLPVLRLLMRNLAAMACSCWEDAMPETTILTVEVFNSIYIAQSMQSGNSIVMAAVVVAIDLGYSLYTLRRLQSRVLSIKRSRHLANLNSQPVASADPQQDLLLQSLVHAFTNVTTVSFPNVRVLGSFPHTIPPSNPRVELLKRICSTTASTDRLLSSGNTQSGSYGVVPVVPTHDDKLSKNSRWIEQSLRLLFHCEYVVLAEYVESIVSALCVAYLAAIFELPNLQFYPYQVSIDVELRSWIVLRLAVFAAMEFASLIYVLVQMQRQVGFSTLHMLAFVLETQFNVAQGKFAMWVVVVFQFTLVHFGSDFPALLRWIKGVR